MITDGFYVSDHCHDELMMMMMTMKMMSTMMLSCCSNYFLILPGQQRDADERDTENIYLIIFPFQHLVWYQDGSIQR